MEPLVELVAAHADVLGHGAGPLAVGEPLDDPGPLHEAGLVGARAGEPSDGLALLGRQLAELDLGRHGAPPVGDTPDSMSRILPDEPLSCGPPMSRRGPPDGNPL